MSDAQGLGRVVLASNNAGKLRELASLLDAAGIELIAQGELGVPEAPEPHANPCRCLRQPGGFTLHPGRS